MTRYYLPVVIGALLVAFWLSPNAAGNRRRRRDLPVRHADARGRVQASRRRHAGTIAGARDTVGSPVDPFRHRRDLGIAIQFAGIGHNHLLSECRTHVSDGRGRDHFRRQYRHDNRGLAGRGSRAQGRHRRVCDADDRAQHHPRLPEIEGLAGVRICPCRSGLPVSRHPSHEGRFRGLQGSDRPAALCAAGAHRAGRLHAAGHGGDRDHAVEPRHDGPDPDRARGRADHLRERARARDRRECRHDDHRDHRLAQREFPGQAAGGGASCLQPHDGSGCADLHCPASRCGRLGQRRWSGSTPTTMR